MRFVLRIGGDLLAQLRCPPVARQQRIQHLLRFFSLDGEGRGVTAEVRTTTRGGSCCHLGSRVYKYSNASGRYWLLLRLGIDKKHDDRVKLSD